MESKKWYASRTLWTNVVGFVAAVTGVFGVDIGLDAETQVALVGGILTVVNIVLRLVTKAPVST